MVGKAFLVFCAQALLVKSAFSQCIGRAGIAGPALSPGLAPGLGCGLASSGGGFAVNSFSPISPTGITVRSENAIEGSLSVGGDIPFLGAVALEGILPTAGAGAISYGCGNGAIGITSEGPIATGITTPGNYGPGVAGVTGPAYGPGIAGTAYGSGIAGNAYGSGIAGPVYGPGIVGSAFGPNIAGPAYGTGIAGPFGPGMGAGPLYGAGLAPGLGYNGFGIGCGAL